MFTNLGYNRYNAGSGPTTPGLAKRFGGEFRLQLERDNPDIFENLHTKILHTYSHEKALARNLDISMKAKTKGLDVKTKILVPEHIDNQEAILAYVQGAKALLDDLDRKILRDIKLAFKGFHGGPPWKRQDFSTFYKVEGKRGIKNLDTELEKMKKQKRVPS